MSVHRRPVFDLTFVLKPPWVIFPTRMGHMGPWLPLTKYLGLLDGSLFCVIQAFFLMKLLFVNRFFCGVANRQLVKDMTNPKCDVFVLLVSHVVAIDIVLVMCSERFSVL